MIRESLFNLTTNNKLIIFFMVGWSNPYSAAKNSQPRMRILQFFGERPNKETDC